MLAHGYGGESGLVHTDAINQQRSGEANTQRSVGKQYRTAKTVSTNHNSFRLPHVGALHLDTVLKFDSNLHRVFQSSIRTPHSSSKKSAYED